MQYGELLYVKGFKWINKNYTVFIIIYYSKIHNRVIICYLVFFNKFKFNNDN